MSYTARCPFNPLACLVDYSCAEYALIRLLADGDKSPAAWVRVMQEAAHLHAKRTLGSSKFQAFGGNST